MSKRSEKSPEKRGRPKQGVRPVNVSMPDIIRDTYSKEAFRFDMSRSELITQIGFYILTKKINLNKLFKK